MTTLHALQRTNERTGFNLKTSKRFILTALKRGKGAENFSTREKEYLLQTEDGKRAIVHNSYCFIVSEENVCITMFQTPKWFGKKSQYNGKNKIKNAKKYLRYSDYYEMEDDEYGFRKVS